MLEKDKVAKWHMMNLKMDCFPNIKNME
jgi:hypothetical protein